MATLGALCGWSQTAAPPLPRTNFYGLGAEPEAAAVARGQQAFTASCGFCHGSLAKGGNNGPDLVRSILVLHDEGSGTQIGPVIRDGRVSKGMPRFTMAPEELMDIAAFLQARVRATIIRGEYTYQNIVTGDPKAGLAFFKSNCTACHSPTGDLAGVGGRFEPVALQARLLYPRTRTSPKSQVTVTVTPSSGPAVSGALKWIDDFSVALTDSSGQHRSWLLTETPGMRVALHDPLDAHEQLLKRYSDTDMHNVLAWLVTLK